MTRTSLHRTMIIILLSILTGLYTYAQVPEAICDTLTTLELMEQAEQEIILLRNENTVIPFRSLNQGNFALIRIGEAPDFVNRVQDYLEMPVLDLTSEDSTIINEVIKTTEAYNRLIIVVSTDTVSRPVNEWIVQRDPDKEKTIVFMSGKESLSTWQEMDKTPALLFSPRNTTITQDISAQILFGAVEAKGKLMTSIGGMFEKGEGLSTEGGLRMKYTVPEEEGVNSQRLTARIDSIIDQAINTEAFPGCQILMAVNGKVLFRKSYGHHTYNKRTEVCNNDLYDLASVTKVSSALPLLMQLDGNKRIELDQPFSTYWPDWQKHWFHRSNKDTLTMRQLLTHQGRLVPFIPFWRESQKNGHCNRRFFRFQPEEGFSSAVDDHLYISDQFKKNVYRAIRKSDLTTTAGYKYSDLSFIIYPGMITLVTGQDYEQLLYESVYKPIGASRLVYNPLNKGFSKEEIPPTEEDTYFRKNLVHGRVHDESSAAMGGISGNAGLFANANDLAKLMHLYLNMGSYGGEQLIPREIMETYIQPQFPGNRRALGFDKPLPDNASKTPDDAWPAPAASQQSFGHSGFTGTFVWMDPQYNIVYVFLSNRVYPNRSHNNISKLNVRTAVQQVLYEELGK